MKNEKIIEEAEEWETVESDFFKFEKKTDSIEGKITAIEQINNLDGTKKFDIVTLKQKNNDFVNFHTSKQLDDLMNQVVIGDYIRVTFIDTQSTPAGELKIFNLERKK